MVMAGLVLTICSTWVQKQFMAILIQLFTFFVSLNLLEAMHLYNRNVSDANIIAFLFAVFLSFCCSVIFGGIF
jgi:hypothetical protein